MKKKKYLACLLAMSMMLVSASPMAVSADAQDIQADVSFEDDLDAEGLDVSVDEETEPEESEDDAAVSDQTGDTDLFSSEAGEDAIVDAGDSDTNEGWKPLTTLINENRILYKYDENEKTLYFKCTEPIAIPDYNYGNRTDWFVDLGADKIAQIEKIVIGDGITGIGESCFETYSNSTAYSSLKEVVLPNTVTNISAAAFCDDASLATINLNNVQSVGLAAFSGTGIEKVTFDSEKVEIGENAFADCTSLQSVKAKEISSLGECSFQNCNSLTSFEYEGTITTIPSEAFYGTGLMTFRFGGVEKIGSMAFRKSALKSGCYDGTREGWQNLVGNNKDFANVSVHCKGEAVEAKDATCSENGWKEVGVCEVCGEHYSYPTDENAIPATGHTWSEDYVVDKEATCTEAGEKSKHCTVCGAKEDVQVIPATGHKFSAWKVSTGATVFNAEKQERTCASCGVKETRTNGTALKATVSVNASNVKLKVKQSTTGLKVTGLAKGDSVKTWRSTNTKIFTVKGNANGTCKLTAKKAGTAKLQITIASGLKKNVTIKVQKSAVKTTKVTVASRKVTIQKGKKTALKPVVTPFTSRQKVTYTSSNKKVATVSKKGVVTGKKKGTAKITVRSGNKTVKVTVRVK